MTGAATEFDHRLFVHDGDDEWLEAALLYARDGLALGEAIVVVDEPDRLEMLAVALGPDGDRVRLEDGDRWWQGPWRTFAAYERTVRDLLDDHPVVRAIAHPTWLASEENREWRRFESFANLHFDGWPYRSLCPYDPKRLGDHVCTDATATHPLLHTTAGARPNQAFVDPHTFVSSCLRDVPATPVDLRLVLGSVEDLHRVRSAAADWAAQQEVPSSAIERLVLALSELATNALRHGAGAAGIELALHHETMVMSVADEGREPIDPLSPYRPPDPGVVGGWGLWVVATLCDEIEIVAGPEGNRVRCALDI